MGFDQVRSALTNTVRSRLLTVGSRSLFNGASIAYLKAQKLGKTALSPLSRSSLSIDENNPYLSLLFRLSLFLYLFFYSLQSLTNGWLPSHSPSSYLEGYVTHDNVAEQQKPNPTWQGYAILFLKVTSGCSPKIRALD
ncbi:hypothetical protein MRB53_010318 [Persea americana]|uniref:Uncharacterized protein n=1 Tax=Persea americana TaxID=3435 RepID=A0ACC2LSN3_PERAE|nr:hypothetical protein MRB53_010318 [Persea americana]